MRKIPRDLCDRGSYSLLISSSVKLKHFQKFVDTTEALAATTSAIEGKLPKSLRNTLKSIYAEEAQETLAVADAKLGSAIKGTRFS